MIAYHCDREGCDSWARGALRSEFIVVILHPHKRHFCCLDCLMHWAAANSEPTESVEL